MILLIGGIKGGSGKTTLAVNLAVLRACGRKSVLLIDADDQRSSYEWYDERRKSNKAHYHLEVVPLIGKTIYKEIEQAAKQYDDIIIDAGGRDSESQRAVLTIANKYLVPFKPKSLDLWTIHQVIRLKKEALLFNPKLKSYTVINQSEPRGSDNDDCKKALASYKDFTFIDVTIGNRKAFSKAIDDGLAVVELDRQDQKANNEIIALYEAIYKK